MLSEMSARQTELIAMPASSRVRVPALRAAMM